MAALVLWGHEWEGAGALPYGRAAFIADRSACAPKGYPRHGGGRSGRSVTGLLGLDEFTDFG